MKTMKGKLMACRIRFSLRVWSTCFKVRGCQFVLDENDTAEGTGANSSETLEII